MTEYEAGRELDALIAERVMGWQRCHAELHGGSGFPPGQSFSIHNIAVIPHYSTDWGAAGQVMEHFATQGRYLWLCYEAVSYLRADTMHWAVSFAAPGQFRATADSAPLAICRAALRYQEIMAGSTN